MRFGMGCKAQTTDIALAMARICNTADRPRPRLHTREEIVNTFLAVPTLCVQGGQLTRHVLDVLIWSHLQCD